MIEKEGIDDHSPTILVTTSILLPVRRKWKWGVDDYLLARCNTDDTGREKAVEAGIEYHSPTRLDTPSMM